jgi:GT2 family glycosyltransferase
MSVPTVSVIICAYTEARWDSLVAGVQASFGQTHSPDQVVVVCDHNAALARRAVTEFPMATVIDNGLGRGLSGARNSGVEASLGEVVAFLDDDAVPDPTWLEHLIAPFADTMVVGTGGTAAPAWIDGRPGWLPDEFLWVVGCSYRGLPEQVASIRNPIGASMAFRRDAIVKVGGFAADLGRIGKTPLGCEETELSIRVLREHPGHRVLLVPGARVSHDVTPDRTTWSYFRARCFAEGVSKAAVARMAGQDAALSSERSYVARTLPAGVLRGAGGALRGRLADLGQALAIVAGLGITTAGYLRGRLSAPGAPIS